ncbi:hypothetical protein ACFLXN_02725 [Chloroflexota bacterium]
MMSFLRSPKADLDIVVRGGPFYPGSDVNVEVSLLPKQDFHVRKGVLELLCIETYWDVVTYYVSSGKYGGSYRTRTQKCTRPLVNLSEPFMGDTSVSIMDGYSNKVKFILPENAPPTVKGHTAHIVWSLKASLDIARARDIHKENEVVVLPVPLAEVADEEYQRLSHTIAESVLDQCKLSLLSSITNIQAGGTIDGELQVQVQSDEELRPREIRVELLCSEVAGSRAKEIVEDAVVLQKDEELYGHSFNKWPFQLRVPIGLMPSVAVGNSHVVWHVKGTLDIKMKKDFVVDGAIQVSSAL